MEHRGIHTHAAQPQKQAQALAQHEKSGSHLEALHAALKASETERDEAIAAGTKAGCNKGVHAGEVCEKIMAPCVGEQKAERKDNDFAAGVLGACFIQQQSYVYCCIGVCNI